MCSRPNYHLPMHELTRLAYLEAMGIDSYVCRTQLPAAATSRKLRVVRRSALPVAPAVEPPQQQAQSAPARTETPAAGTDIPVFSVVAVDLGGCYWLDEIPPGRSLGPDYTQLLQAICLALGWNANRPVLEQFNWPLSRGGLLDQGIDSARAGFAGFLAGRLERIQPQRVVLLGEPDSSWFDHRLLSQHQVTRTVSAWKMLRQPELKRRAWLDLQVLRDVP